MRRRAVAIFLVITIMTGLRAMGTQFAFQINFTDKNNTTFSLGSPLAYLSPRAIARRTMQGIAIDSTDLPVSAAYIDSVLTLTGGTMHECSRWFNCCVILISDSATIHVLDGKPYISCTRMVGYYAGMLHRPAGNNGSQQEATVYKGTAGDAGYYNQAWDQTNMVHGNDLYDRGYQGTGKLIAVIDAGFPGVNTHPGFTSVWGSGRIADMHNFTLATDFVLGYDAHGMKVLSTMAGYAPGTYVGSAPQASYALYVTEDGNSEQPIELLNMECATERADSLGADIVTTSLGYNTFSNTADNLVYATDLDGKTTIAARGANIATSKGMLFVASAGNEGGNGWNMILTPGDADSALTIGSVDITGANAPNSGYGPNAAGQVKPDVCAMGQPANIFNTTGGYGSESGTSFSTPQVAGWAACLWQAMPAARPYDIRQAIIKCASKYSNSDAHMGYGIPNFMCSSQLLLNTPVLPPGYVAGQWLVAAPNPFTADLMLTIRPDTDQYVAIAVMDVTGKLMAMLHKYCYKGFNAPVYLQLPQLARGVYILKASSATQQQVIKIEKL